MVPAGSSTGLIDQLKAHLRAKLPEYMVPAHYVLVEQLPLTANGKIDRKALPAPDYGRREDERPYVAPRTPTEETLAGIWADVLGAPRVSVDDNFFELGGDSILTIQVIARCRQAGLRFTPRDLAKRPTIALLAEVIESAAPPAAAEPESARGPVALDPDPELVLRAVASPTRTIGTRHSCSRSRPDLDLEALQQALGHVVGPPRRTPPARRRRRVRSRR